MIEISPTSIRDFKAKANKIKEGLKKAESESADRLSDIVKNNIKLGYLKAPLGSDKNWQFITDSYARSIDVTPGDVNAHPGLVVTGEMLNSVKKKVSKDGTTVLVDNWKAVIHEYGTVDLPSRPFFNPATFYFKNTNTSKNAIDKHLKEVFTDV